MGEHIGFIFVYIANFWLINVHNLLDNQGIQSTKF